MELSFPAVTITQYKSSAQIARVLTEAWAAKNLYCAACKSDRLAPTKNNARAVDFICPDCNEGFQLKGGKSLPGTRIVDAAYSAMIAAIRSDRAPNLVYLHYDLDLGIQNLILIPRFFFTEQCIEQRKPLAATARRAGWVGCNIRLDRIAPEGRIEVVSKRVVVSRGEVRAGFSRLAPLRQIPPGLRGWVLAVLLQIHTLSRQEFTLGQLYEREGKLADMFPNNRNVRPKIRQQLQVLRDLGLIEFTSPGRYRLI